MRKRRKKKKRKKTAQKGLKPFIDLVIAVDFSKGKGTMYGLTGTTKSQLFGLTKNSPWLKHISEIKSKQERKAYISKFPNRFQQIKPRLTLIEIDPDWKKIKQKIQNKRLSQLIIDDTLYYRHGFQKEPNVILESKAKKHRELRSLVLIADNLAYIGRKEYERVNDTRKLKERLRRLGII